MIPCLDGTLLSDFYCCMFASSRVRDFREVSKDSFDGTVDISEYHFFISLHKFD